MKGKCSLFLLTRCVIGGTVERELGQVSAGWVHYDAQCYVMQRYATLFIVTHRKLLNVSRGAGFAYYVPYILPMRQYG